MNHPMQSTFNFTDPSWEVNDQTTVIALSGASIDTSGAQWRLSATEVLNWDLMPLQPGTTLVATHSYIRNSIRKWKPSYILSQFKFLKSTFLAAADSGFHINEASEIDIALFDNLRIFLREGLIKPALCRPRTHPSNLPANQQTNLAIVG